MLGAYERLIWKPNYSGPGRRHRRGGVFRAFVPFLIAELDFDFDAEAVAALVTATKAIDRLNASPHAIAALEPLARNLLRSEAVASSRIEGLELSHKRLARAAYRPDERVRHDRRATEILANVEALQQAVALGAAARPLAVSDIQDIHRTLLRHTFDARIAGVVRDSQNWIGGSDYHPLDAAYVPPPHFYLDALLEDLCAFIERDDVAPVAQAAIAHAQFETIHAFADGNGRVGRALVHTSLRRRGEATRCIPPISLVLASQPSTYIAGLVDYREGRISDWCTLFATATQQAAELAGELSGQIEALQQQWLEQLGHPRSDAAIRQLIAALPALPVIDVPAGQRLTGKSHVAVGAAIRQLEAAGILQPLNEKKWGRLWECGPLLQLVGDFERDASAPRA